MLFFDFLRRSAKKKHVSDPINPVVIPPSSHSPYLHYYPHTQPSLPVVDCGILLQQHQDMITRIKTLAVFSNDYPLQSYHALITLVASYYSLLPASRAHHHHMPGGLLRHSIETAIYALQHANSRLMPKMIIPSLKHKVEPAWHFTVFAAGLLHDCGKILSDVCVSSPDGIHVWQPLSVPLLTWMDNLNLQSCNYVWIDGRVNRHHSINLIVATRILPDDFWSRLASIDIDLLYWFVDTIQYRITSCSLYEIIIKADQYSVEQDMRNTPTAPSGASVGLADVLGNAIRHLITSGKWQVNVAGSCVWYFHNSYYLVWPECLRSLADYLASENITGIPRNPDLLKDILSNYNMIMPDNVVRFRPEGLYFKNEDDCLFGVPLNSAILDSLPAPTTITVAILQDTTSVESSGTSDAITESSNDTSSVAQVTATEPTTSQEPNTSSPVSTYPTVYNLQVLADYFRSFWQNQRSSQERRYFELHPKGCNLQYPESLSLFGQSPQDMLLALARGEYLVPKSANVDIQANSLIEDIIAAYVYDRPPIQYITLTRSFIETYLSDLVVFPEVSPLPFTTKLPEPTSQLSTSVDLEELRTKLCEWLKQKGASSEETLLDKQDLKEAFGRSIKQSHILMIPGVSKSKDPAKKNSYIIDVVRLMGDSRTSEITQEGQGTEDAN